MSWPLSQDYNEAIQNPVTSLGDADLKKGHPALNALGLPIPRSGNFADVYHFYDTAGKSWALKCFTRQVAGLRERYAAIDAHLRSADLPFTVGFSYLADGVRIRNDWFPLLKMQWVEGFTLNEFLKDNLTKTAYLEALFLMWVRLAKRLRQAKIAHGDLQHANVLLVPGASATKLELKLIDYDGMWVPALADTPSGEVGHANYQHPLRAKQLVYGPDVDRFPHLVIACALRGLIVAGPDLWSRFDNGDNLLFREADLKAPGESALVRALWDLHDPVLSPLLGHLVLAARQPMGRTPWLDELLVSEASLALTGEQEQSLGKLLGVAVGRSAAAPAATEYWQAATPADIFAALKAQPREPRERGSALVWLIACGAVLLGLGLLIGPILLLALTWNTPSASTTGTPTSSPETIESLPKKPKPVDPSRPEPRTPEIELLQVMPRIVEPLRPIVNPSPKPAPVTLVWSVPGRAAARCLDFSRDGKLLIASPGKSKDLYLFDTGDGKSRSKPIDTGVINIRALGCAAEGAVLVFGEDDAAVVDHISGEVRSVILPQADLVALSVSPDGRDALCPDKAVEGRILRIGLDTRGSNGTWTTPDLERIVDVHFLSDGKSAAALDAGFRIHLLDLVSDAQVSWSDLSRSATRIAASPNGRQLLTFGKSNKIRLWDVGQKKVLHVLDGHPGGTKDAAFTRDGRVLSVGADKALRVWDGTTGQELQKHDLPEMASCVCVSPDGGFAATASITGPAAAVQLWRLRK
jgi:WD40 repeat protein